MNETHRHEDGCRCCGRKLDCDCIWPSMKNTVCPKCYQEKNFDGATKHWKGIAV